MERLNILSKKGILPGDMQNNIRSAFEFLLQLLLHSQLMKKEAQMEIDNIIEPEKLSMLEKKTLKEIFQLLPVLKEKAEFYIRRRETAAQ